MTLRNDKLRFLYKPTLVFSAYVFHLYLFFFLLPFYEIASIIPSSQYYTPPPNMRTQYNHFVYDNRNMPVTPPRNSQNPHRLPQNTVLLSDITNANARFQKLPPPKSKPQTESNPSPPKAKTPPSGRTPKKPGQSERKPNS